MKYVMDFILLIEKFTQSMPDTLRGCGQQAVEAGIMRTHAPQRFLF
ncbi:MAG: hypothetical protein ABIQ54_01805 [Gammaproteobacteria bacterium]